MALRDAPIEEAKDHAESAARRASPWVVGPARAGYVAKGVVYATIGLLAMLEALGVGGKTASPDGAIRSIGARPLGQLLLVVLAAGLFGYAVWKVVQGSWTRTARARTPPASCAASPMSGAASSTAPWPTPWPTCAAQSVFGAEDSSEDAMTASAMAYKPPVAQVLVGLVGLVAIGIGLYQFHAAYKARFLGDLKLNEMSASEEHLATFAGRAGTATRAVAINVAGAFVLLAAYQSDPKETLGLGGVLEGLQHQPLGSYMLGTVATGLLLYGAFMFAIARYRRIEAT